MIKEMVPSSFLRDATEALTILGDGHESSAHLLPWPAQALRAYRRIVLRGDGAGKNASGSRRVGVCQYHRANTMVRQKGHVALVTKWATSVADDRDAILRADHEPIP